MTDNDARLDKTIIILNEHTELLKQISELMNRTISLLAIHDNLLKIAYPELVTHSMDYEKKARE